MRSYGEYCAVARSLDVLGDRWTLLIVRELLARGGCRYTDLRHGLPGIASNLLAERLRDLEAEGVVQREAAPPPIATTLFRLTARGEQLRPVLNALTVWGLPLMGRAEPDDAVRSHWLAAALELFLVGRTPDEAGPSHTIELQTADGPITLTLERGSVATALVSTPHPDLALAGPPMPIMGLLLGRLTVAQAHERGVSWDGDLSVLDRLTAPVLAGPQPPA
jgi:DNA-binding HxlR family transcriptional regulator